MTNDWREVRDDNANIEAIRELCMDDFKMFVKFTFKYVYRKRFLWSNHHDKIVNALMRVWLGIDRNLIINIPPRYSKTEMICLFSAWAFIHNPSCEFLHLSYADTLVKKNSDKIRSIIKSEFYRDLFAVEINPKKDSQTEWHTIEGGIFYATSTGGQVTGFGAGSADEYANNDYTFSGCILIDDPLKPDDAHTIRREQINERWEETIKSRRNNPRTTPVICIMQRVHEDDFTAELLRDKQEAFKVLKMPALMENETKALWDKKHTVEQLQSMKERNLYVYSSQYQQEPTPAGGSIFKREWWKYYTELPKLERVIITADTAQKVKEHNDYSVVQCWGLAEDKIYLLDQIRGKWEAPQLKEVSEAFIAKMDKIYSVRTVYIEDKASGTGLIQSIKSRPPILAIQRHIDKITRAYDAAPHIQSGRVYLPEGSAITNTFLQEATSFNPKMTHMHDDQVDPMMDAVDMLLDKVNQPALADEDMFSMF